MLKTIHNKIYVAIEVVLYMLLAFMPFAFGVVHAWSEEVVIVSAAVLVALFGIGNLTSSQKTIRFTLALPLIMIFVLISVLQLIPMPFSVVQTIAPSTAQVKSELLSKLPSLEGNLDSAGSEQTHANTLGTNPSMTDIQLHKIDMPISFYSYATLHDLRMVLSIIAVFIVVYGAFRTPARIKRLLVCITIIGGAVAALAILQVITRTDKIFWIVPIESAHQGIAEAGPFVNHSNFSQFINLSIGAAIAFLFVRFHELFGGQQVSMVRIANYMTSPAGRWIWFCLGMLIISISSIFLSLSRGGMIALLIATSGIVLLLTFRGPRVSIHGRGWVMVVMALGAFVCVLYIGFDAVYERLATLQEVNKAEGGRWQIIQDISSAWVQFPLFGTGLGTHQVVFTMFDRSDIPALAAYAENEYAQLLEETGLSGFIPMVLFGITVWIAFYKNIHFPKTPINSAAYGLGFGLLAILIQSLSDFGQHLPANAILTAIFCAVLLAISKKKDAPNSNRSEVSDDLESRSKTATQLVIFKNEVSTAMIPAVNKAVGITSIFCCLLLLWLILMPGGANDARLAEKQWQQASQIARLLQENQWQGTSEQFLSLLRFAQSSVELQLGNVEYRHWLNTWRWQSIARVNEPSTGQIILPAPAINHVRRLVDEFTDGIRLCPTFGQSWCMAGQLIYFVLGEESDEIQTTATTIQLPREVKDAKRNLKAVGADMIRTGRRLAPCDAMVCFVAGLLEISEYKIHKQDIEYAVPGYSNFKRAVALDGRLYMDIARVYMDISRPDLAMELAADDVNRLSRLANLMVEDQINSALVIQVRSQLAKLLEIATTGPAVKPEFLASLAAIYAKDSEPEKAIELYRKALAANYSNITWRLNLAHLLSSIGRTEDAKHEARICLRLNPNNQLAIRLIEQLSMQIPRVKDE